VATLLSWVLRLFMALMGLVFLLGLVAALGLYVVWAAVRWLLTGRKPQVVMVWQQFSAMRKSFGQGGGFRQPGSTDSRGPWSKGPSSVQDDQVVDVEVREVREDAPRLPPKRQD
jgi:uncharacterized membrane protein YgcG